ncbi:hypothetical protein ACIHCX_03310 [Streptomyces sp. NPDC052043]|uniref:hypothetical protein n=1 Tax=Streptomyces sp. NPDC052043 TaxID=3365684 RepID=UPI0037CF7400
MTASPSTVNGQARPPALPMLGDWQPIEATPTPEIPEPAPEVETKPAAAQPDNDLIAQAEAEAIRSKAWAESEERRLAAEAEKEAALKRADAEAEAIRIKATEDARKTRLANDRAERKETEEKEASEARIAESRKRKADADRARADAERKDQEQQAAENEAAEEIKTADDKWRSYAIRFAVVCGIVSLPVQMSFFWNPKAPWMAAAPIMLEGAAWVVHRGAHAAVANRRPVWHYRTIVWLLSFLAAGVNLYHGLHSFDPGTALATAFASIAGPGVWDLHEHGRIRKRDGALSRKERKAQRRAERAKAAQKAAEEAQKRAEQEAANKAAAEAADMLAGARAEEFPDVWDEAEKIAAAVGEVTVTEAVWARAYRNIQGCDPGESIESITARRKAEARVESALSGTPVNTLSKNKNAQRGAQTPRSSNKPVPPVRKAGDTPRYHRAAGRAHGDLLRRSKAAKSTRPNDN